MRDNKQKIKCMDYSNKTSKPQPEIIAQNIINLKVSVAIFFTTFKNNLCFNIKSKMAEGIYE